MKILLPIALIFAFVWLAKTSQAGGYDMAEVERINQLVSCSGVADVWQLCGEDLAKPVELFGGDNG